MSHLTTSNLNLSTSRADVTVIALIVRGLQHQIGYICNVQVYHSVDVINSQYQFKTVFEVKKSE